MNDFTVQQDMDKLRTCLEDILGGEPIGITWDTELASFGLDSLNIKELGYMIEDEFDIENADSLEITKGTTIGALIAQVRGLRDG